MRSGSFRVPGRCEAGIEWPVGCGTGLVWSNGANGCGPSIAVVPSRFVSPIGLSLQVRLSEGTSRISKTDLQKDCISMKRLFRLPIVWLAAAVLTLGVSACSSADNGSDEAGEDTAQTESAETTSESSSDPSSTESAPTDAPAPNIEMAASHILVAYQGAARANPEVTRTKEEAMTRAQELAKRAQGGEDFAQLARDNSDGPTAPRGGDLGIFAAGRMVPEFSQACAKLEIGQVSDPVETDFGFHVIRRNKIERISARHILIMHKDSQRVPPEITRTRDEALARAQEVLEKARGGEDFGTLASEYSDGPTKTRGGDLGAFGKGAMVPDFETAAFNLGVNEISDVVETPFGFHIIMRYQ